MDADEDIKFELQYVVGKSAAIKSNFAREMSKFEEEKTFSMFYETCKTKLDEMELCLKNLKDMAISLGHYCKTYSDIVHVIAEIERKKKARGSNEEKRSFKDYI